MLHTVKNAIFAMAIGVMGGYVFWWFSVPLPWMLGSLAATAVFSGLGNPWPMPRSLLKIARPVIGVLAGSAFSPDVVALLPTWWASVLLVILYSFAISAVGFVAFVRIFKLDPVTAYFSSTPGGLSELSLIGSSLGGDMRALVTIHTIRVIMVVCSIPLLLQFGLGYEVGAGRVTSNLSSTSTVDWVLLVLCGGLGMFLGSVLRFAGSVLIISMLASAIVHATGLTAAKPPEYLIIAAQVLVGSIAGGRFANISFRAFGRLIAIAIGWSIFMIISAIGAAWFFANILGVSFVSLLIAIVPGGTMEMITISFVLGADTAFVGLAHLSRVLLVQAGAPALFSIFGKNVHTVPKDD